MDRNRNTAVCDLVEVFSHLARADAATLISVQNEISRMVRTSNNHARDKAAAESKTVVRQQQVGHTKLGSVSLGAKFVYRAADIFGSEYANTHKDPHDGKVMTVVAFKPRYVNQILAQDSNGYECLMRLSDIEKALRLKADRVDIDESGLT